MIFKNKAPEATAIKPPNTKKKKWGVKRVALLCCLSLLLIIVAAGGTFAAKTYLALKKVVVEKKDFTAEGLKGDLDLTKLGVEGSGRVNVLLLGVGDEGHAGELLSDTMIFASIDPKSREVVMVSLPRDLYVKIPGYWWSKINAAHAFAEQDKTGSGPEVAKATVSEVLGQPIHYFVRVDFTGLKKAVDALGGVDIYNKESLSDYDYPCERNEGLACGFNLKAGFYHMDGALALKYARCRKGTCGDDFGRAARQQSVVVAMRDQALKAGNILNPTKVSELIDIVGGHLKTDMSTDEIRKFIEVGRRIDSNQLRSKVLDGENEGLVRTSYVGDASVVVPVAGVGNYAAIRAFVAKYLLDGYIVAEQAKVEIQAAGAGPAKVYEFQNRLRSLGYNVVAVRYDSAGDSKTSITKFNDQKPYTIKYLENRLNTTATSDNKQKSQSSDIIIMLGNDYEPKDGN